MHRLSKKYYLKIFLLIAVFVLFILATISLFKISVLNISAKPTDAVVLFDNAPLNLNRQGKARKFSGPGSHKIEVQADGYIGAAQTLKLKRLLPTTLSFNLKKVPDAQALGQGSFISKGSAENEIFYFGDEGRTLYKTAFKDEGGEIKPKIDAMTENKLSGIGEIIWSPNKDLALFRKADGIYLFDFKKYDFVHQTETLWGKNIGSVAWSPDNAKIAYYYAPPSGEKTLIFSNLSNSEQTRILDFNELGIEDPILRWSPDNENLLIVPRNKNFEANKIYILNRYGLQVNSLTDIGNQINAGFSPDSGKVIYLTYSKDPQALANSIISVMKKDGTEKQSLDIRVNFDAIVWLDSNTLLISSTDSVTGNEKLYRYDIANKAAYGSMLINLSKEKITSFATVMDGKILVYQAGQNISYLVLDN